MNKSYFYDHGSVWSIIQMKVVYQSIVGLMTLLYTLPAITNRAQSQAWRWAPAARKDTRPPLSAVMSS